MDGLTRLSEDAPIFDPRAFRLDAEQADAGSDPVAVTVDVDGLFS